MDPSPPALNQPPPRLIRKLAARRRRGREAAARCGRDGQGGRGACRFISELRATCRRRGPRHRLDARSRHGAKRRGRAEPSAAGPGNRAAGAAAARGLGGGGRGPDTLNPRHGLLPVHRNIGVKDNRFCYCYEVVFQYSSAVLFNIADHEAEYYLQDGFHSSRDEKRWRRAGPSAAEPGSRAVAAAAARGLGATRGRRSPTVSAAGWTHSESLLRFFAFDFRKSIRFSVLSGSEIHKFPEVQVWNNRIYGHDMKPVPNGLLDPRMLALPVFNVGFFNCILDVLKCLCKSCRRVLMEKDCREFLKKMRNPRADALQKSATMKKECHY
ncbi:unnamed protein product [Miscanthus lutarioriparius]|uniref:DNA-directed RNA polymerase n=1 Tax=Miscanthus lutarioriparius TaxID=422564 RepID=A0A811S6K9_9POAL|nr:unnamed protein product [Miscanthus lutarioriparius]